MAKKNNECIFWKELYKKPKKDDVFYYYKDIFKEAEKKGYECIIGSSKDLSSLMNYKYIRKKIDFELEFHFLIRNPLKREISAIKHARKSGVKIDILNFLYCFL